MFFHKTCWSVALALMVLFIGCSLALPARDDGKDSKELTELGSPGGTIHEEVVVGASLYVRKKPERSQSRQLQQFGQINQNRQIVKREIRVQQAEGYDQSKPHNDKSSVGATAALKRSKGASTGSSKTTPAIGAWKSRSRARTKNPSPKHRDHVRRALLVLGHIAEWIKGLTERPPRRSSSSSSSKTCTINRPSSVAKIIAKTQLGVVLWEENG